MVKFFLLLLILVSCTGMGRALSLARKRRADMLGDILAAMRVLRLRMLNSMEPVGVLLRKSELFLFRELGNGLWEGNCLAECWSGMKAAFSKRGHPLDCLTQEDLALLDVFFAGIGNSGRAEQSNLFASCIAQLEEAQLAARNHFVDGAKLYTALGALAGVSICIMIV